MKMMGGEKSRAPGRHFPVSLPHDFTFQPCHFCSPSQGVGRGGALCSLQVLEQPACCIPPGCCALWTHLRCRNLTVRTVNALLNPGFPPLLGCPEERGVEAVSGDLGGV